MTQPAAPKTFRESTDPFLQMQDLLFKAKQVFTGTAMLRENEAVVRAWECHITSNISLEEAAMLAIPALLEEIRVLKQKNGG